MTREIRLPDSLPLDEMTVRAFFCFLQAMANRRAQGAARYGDRPNKKQCYMSRMRKELDAYSRDGNMEQLLNIAVYCFLESEAPENRRFHFDATVASVTRE
jgi:hypothetical protein